MDRADSIWLWILTALAFLAATLRLLLAKKRGSPLPRFRRIQSFVFPAVLIGIAEELILGAVRKRKAKQ